MAEEVIDQRKVADNSTVKEAVANLQKQQSELESKLKETKQLLAFHQRLLGYIGVNGHG